ncbi:hypothetical protein PsyrH_12215 [Pseudomonas syringae pv. syringae HS191]|nr:hypothetical protein PsyrH_12215 [Pseudomonas syringae pv. syringae HS191]
MRCRIIANHLFIKDKFTDLKSLVLWTCRFDPGSGHHIYIKGLRGILLSRPFLFWSAKTVVVCNSKKLFAAFLISYYGTESVSGAGEPVPTLALVTAAGPHVRQKRYPAAHGSSHSSERSVAHSSSTPSGSMINRFWRLLAKLLALPVNTARAAILIGAWLDNVLTTVALNNGCRAEPLVASH